MKNKNKLLLLFITLNLILTGCTSYEDKIVAEIKPGTTKEPTHFEDVIPGETYRDENGFIINDKVVQFDEEEEEPIIEEIVAPEVVVTPEPTVEPTPESTPEPTPIIIGETHFFAYLKRESNFYNTCACEGEEVKYVIAPFQKVLVLEEGDTYCYVQDEDMNYGFIDKNNLEYLPDTYVEIDLSEQVLELYKNHDVILTTLVVTGKDSTPTRIGYFPIKYKTTDRTLTDNKTYWSDVDYWMPFDGGIGLHDAYRWRSTYGPDANHSVNGSHGCVNMPLDAARTTYENVEQGDMVLIHK